MTLHAEPVEAWRAKAFPTPFGRLNVILPSVFGILSLPMTSQFHRCERCHIEPIEARGAMALPRTLRQAQGAMSLS
jgi:hypothetical protein